MAVEIVVPRLAVVAETEGYADAAAESAEQAALSAAEAVAAAASATGIIKGYGAPIDGLGLDGDDYFDLTAGRFYLDKGNPVPGSWTGCAQGLLSSYTGLTYPLPRLDIAIASWLAENAVTTTGGARVIPNEQTATPVSDNLAILPVRRFINSVGGLGFSNTVVTNLYAAGPLGEADLGSRVVGTGTWGIAQQGSTTWPNSTYTLAIWMKSNNGVSQTVAIGKVGSTVNKTVTTTWQRFSETFTLNGGDQFYLCSGAVSSDIVISKYRIDKAASAPADELPAGHMVLGGGPLISTPVITSDEVIVTASTQAGYVQLPAGVALTTFTASMVVNLPDNTSEFHGWLYDSGVVGFCMEPQRSPTTTNAYPEVYFGSTTATFTAPGLYDLSITGGRHVVTIRYDGSYYKLWLDNIPLYRSAASASPFTIRDLNVFGTICNSLKWSAGALWSGSLSDADMNRTYTYFVNRGGGVAVDTIERIVVAAGDSITQSQAPYSYAYKNVTAFNAVGQPSTVIKNISVSGTTLSQQITRASDEAYDLVDYRVSGQMFIYSLLDTNDIALGYPGYGSYAAWMTAFLAHCQDMKDRGFVVIVPTIPPRADTAFNTARNTANAEFRAAVGAEIDAVADFAADATYGTDAAGFNGAYYPDGIHPAVAVQDAFRAIWAAAVIAAS